MEGFKKVSQVLEINTSDGSLAGIEQIHDFGFDRIRIFWEFFGSFIRLLDQSLGNILKIVFNLFLLLLKKLKNLNIKIQNE